MEENCSIKLFESDLESMLSQVLAKACSRDEKLKAAKEKSAMLKHQNEKLNAVLDLEKPSALTEENPLIKTIHLHLDNDKTGRLCTKTLKELLGNKYEVFDEPPKKGKDYNDYLCIQLGIYKSKERSYER